MSSFYHVCVVHLHHSISTYCMSSSAHPGVSGFCTIIPTYFYSSPLFPWILLHGFLTLLSPPWFPQYFSQSCPKLPLRPLLEPPCIPPVLSPLVALLYNAHFKDHPQCHPLCHSPLLYLYVGHIRLSSCCYPQYFWPEHLPYPVCYLSRPLPCDLSQKSVCVHSTFLSISAKITQVFNPKRSTTCATAL